MAAFTRARRAQGNKEGILFSFVEKPRVSSPGQRTTEEELSRRGAYYEENLSD